MLAPHPLNLHRVARQCGVTLVDAEDNRSSGRKPGLCACKPTARAIGQAHGEAHLALVFRLCTETGNGLELHAATLQALSFLILVEVIPIGSALFEAFDRIDLGHVRRLARAMPGSTKHNMVALLYPMLTGTAMFEKAAA
ncbi:hypothetical protein ASD50_18265 [Mesorhizobium sp. Root552]|jgi:hypothetical protein|uniref:hypothetical protein n=1 Tax=Mesorhizobium sp. Root552 TaxID=1736555 RepID=UPI0006F9AAB0|nr:hypothetical protein [Mesorhizobium sp. Root552]KQZ29137.1 hypothetical protein ASD50_18265 [Mesorhizobium sp. Root552]